MKQNLAVLGGVVALAVSAHANIQITNGDFQNNAPASNTWDVDSWYNSLPTANGQLNNWWWEGTWYGPTVSPNGTSVMGLGYMFTTTHWAYQSVGVNDSSWTSLPLEFDVGSFTDAGMTRNMGLTFSVYQSDGSFVGADNVDIAGAAGITLIDTVSLTSGDLAPGQVVHLGTSLSLGTANATDELYLRIENYSTGVGEPWAAIDNITIPEPSSLALAGLGGLALLLRRRVKR